GPQVGVLRQALQVALEVAVIDGIEADQGREEAPVRLGDAIAHQIALPAQERLKLIERGEQCLELLFIDVLTGGESYLVHAIVDGVVNPGVDGIDLRQQCLRRVISCRGTESVEGRIEHADDLRRLVVDDGIALPIPQHRHRYPTAVAWLRTQINLIEVAGVPNRVSCHTFGGFEGPAVVSHVGIDHRYAEDRFEFLQCPQDHHPVRPGAGHRHIEMIAACFSLEPRVTTGPGTAIGGDPVPELRVAAYKAASGAGSVVPLVQPFAVHEKSHTPSSSVACSTGHWTRDNTAGKFRVILIDLLWWKF